MRSEHCSSSAISLSRHSQIYVPKWRRQRRRVRRAVTGSLGFVCEENLREAAGTPPGLNPSPPYKIPGLVLRHLVAKMLIPQPQQPPPRLALAHSKTNCGRYSMSYSGRASDCETRQNYYEGNWTRGTRRPPRNLSLERCRLAVGIAQIWCNCEVKEMLYSLMLLNLKPQQQSVLPQRRPLPWEGWTMPWKHRRGHHKSQRLIQRSSLRFFSRAIPSNFKDNYSSPPFRIR